MRHAKFGILLLVGALSLGANCSKTSTAEDASADVSATDTAIDAVDVNGNDNSDSASTSEPSGKECWAYVGDPDACETNGCSTANVSGYVTIENGKCQLSNGFVGCFAGDTSTGDLSAMMYYATVDEDTGEQEFIQLSMALDTLIDDDFWTRCSTSGPPECECNGANQ